MSIDPQPLKDKIENRLKEIKRNNGKMLPSERKVEISRKNTLYGTKWRKV